MFCGILIEESLRDNSVIDCLKVNEKRVEHPENATNDQPETWTLISYSGNDDQADNVAQSLANSLNEGRWYTNFTTGTGKVYVIFPGKVFTYQRNDRAGRIEAQRYAGSIGIPSSQLDWEE